MKRRGSAWKKNNRREIRRTFGRFLAILAIVALGVGFYSGLQITRDAMVHTGDVYVQQTRLYDYRLMSTLGLTQDDVEAFAQMDGVTAAEGSVSADVLAEWAGAAGRVLKMYTLTQSLNLPKLTAGRMPEAVGECLGDNLLFTEADLGRTVTLTDGNEADTLEQLTVREFTVVGLCSSSYYMNLERGTSRLGTGSVAGFIYVPTGTFDLDYFTEVFVRLDIQQSAFSDAYSDEAEAWEDELKAALERRAALRYTDIVTKAGDELAEKRAEFEDAEAEYQEKRADAEAELADARQELTDAEQEIADGEATIAENEQKLADGRAEYADGLKAYEDGLAEYESGRKKADRELRQGQQQIDEQRAAAEAGKQQIEASGVLAQYEQLKDAQAQLSAGLETLEAKQAEVEAQRKQASEGLTQIDSGLTQLSTGLSQAQAGLTQIEASGVPAQYEQLQAQLQQAKGQLAELTARRDQLTQSVDEIDAALSALPGQIAAAQQAVADTESALNDSNIGAARQQLADARAEVNSLSTQLADVESQLSAAEPGSEEAAALSARRDALSAQRSEAQARAEQIENGEAYRRGQALEEELARQKAALSELSGSQSRLEQQRAEAEAGLNALEQPMAQASQAVSAVEAGISQIDQSGVMAQYEQLLQTVEGLEQQRAELESQRQSAQQGIEACDAGLAQIAEQRTELEAQQAQVEAGLAQIADSGVMAQYEQIVSGLAQLDAAQAELDAARRQADRELSAAKQKLADAQQALADAAQEIADGERELTDGKQELEDAKAELADGWKSYEEADAEAQQEFADAEAELEDARQKLADAEQEIADIAAATCYALGRNTNVGYASFETDTSVVEGLAKVFPVFFFLVAALVCTTTMTRMVDEQRTQIGTLKALGYSNGAIARKYMGYSGSAALLGCVAGYFIGIHLFPYAVWNAYQMLYKFSDILYLYDWGLFGLSLAASLLCSVGATYAACRVELTQMPAGLMRPKAPKAGKRILLERIPLIWNRLGFLHKVSIRNILRYRKRLFMMILGIGGCTALVLTGFGISDSISNIAEDQYGTIFRYDYVFTFEEDQSEAMQQAFRAAMGDSLDCCVFVGSDSYDVLVPGGVRNATVVATGDPQIEQLVGLSHAGQDVPYPADGQVVINEKLAESAGAQIGDVITIRVDDAHTVDATVGGMFVNYAYNYIFMTDATYEQLFGAPCQHKAAYATTASEDIYGVSAQAARQEGVQTVQVIADMKKRVDNMFESLDSVVLLVLFSACMLAFVVLYNLSNINITERAREIATIKVLGFTRRETASYVFRENIVLTLMGALAGLPAGVALHRFVMEQIQLDSVSFQVRILPVSFGYAVGITFLLTLVVNLVLRRKIQKINMAESLKSVE
ncbi:MAG: FtsX-like permease family protein [Clostridia bacterium]|nr:FtsX-like permease family protein [Clostridia bacterium]